MVNSNIKTIFGMFLITKLLQQGFWRLWQSFAWRLNHALCDAQNLCTLTKEDPVI